MLSGMSNLKTPSCVFWGVDRAGYVGAAGFFGVGWSLLDSSCRVPLFGLKTVRLLRHSREPLDRACQRIVSPKQIRNKNMRMHGCLKQRWLHGGGPLDGPMNYQCADWESASATDAMKN